MASRPGTQSAVLLGPAPASPTVVGEVPDTPAGGELHASVTAPRWVVHYDAGFNANPAAKTAFQAAVDQWAKLVYSPVPISIDASFTALPSGVLGSAGPTNLFRDFPGAPLAGTYYPSALANAKYGSDIDPNTSDIDATFSSSFPSFYFGTDGNTAGKVDFESVVLHELGHGLGFLGGAGKQPNGTWSAKPYTYPFVYDTMTTGNGTPITSISAANLPAAMQAADVRFTGTAAVAANGGVAPKLYAPNPWQSGSSYSHLDEATYPAGNANSLMTPAIGSNEVIHSPGPITLGIFTDTGWTIGGMPTLSMGSTRIVEGNSGARQLRFNVSLSKIVPWKVTAHYATSDDTAKAPSDYTSRTGTLTIPAGSARTTVNITVKGDTVNEPLERLRVRLSSPIRRALRTVHRTRLHPQRRTQLRRPPRIRQHLDRRRRQRRPHHGLRPHALRTERHDRQRPLDHDTRHRHRRGRLHRIQRHLHVPLRHHGRPGPHPDPARHHPRERRNLQGRALLAGRSHTPTSHRHRHDPQRRLIGRNPAGSVHLRVRPRREDQRWASSPVTGARSPGASAASSGVGRLTAEERLDPGEEIGTADTPGLRSQRPSVAHAGTLLRGVGRGALGRPAHRAPPREPEGIGFTLRSHYRDPAAPNKGVARIISTTQRGG